MIVRMTVSAFNVFSASAFPNHVVFLRPLACTEFFLVLRLCRTAHPITCASLRRRVFRKQPTLVEAVFSLHFTPHHARGANPNLRVARGKTRELTVSTRLSHTNRTLASAESKPGIPPGNWCPASFPRNGLQRVARKGPRAAWDSAQGTESNCHVNDRFHMSPMTARATRRTSHDSCTGTARLRFLDRPRASHLHAFSKVP